MAKLLGKGTVVDAGGEIVYVSSVTWFGKARPVIESEEINPPDDYPTPLLGDREVEECEIMYYFNAGTTDPLETAFDADAAVTAELTLPTTPATVFGPIDCKVKSIGLEAITKKGWVSKKATLIRVA